MTHLIDLCGRLQPLDVLRKGRWARHVILDAEDAVVSIAQSRAGMDRFVLLIPEIRKADLFLALSQEMAA